MRTPLRAAWQQPTLAPYAWFSTQPATSRLLLSARVAPHAVNTQSRASRAAGGANSRLWRAVSPTQRAYARLSVALLIASFGACALIGGGPHVSVAWNMVSLGLTCPDHLALAALAALAIASGPVLRSARARLAALALLVGAIACSATPPLRPLHHPTLSLITGPRLPPASSHLARLAYLTTASLRANQALPLTTLRHPLEGRQTGVAVLSVGTARWERTSHLTGLLGAPEWGAFAAACSARATQARLLSTAERRAGVLSTPLTWAERSHPTVAVAASLTARSVAVRRPETLRTLPHRGGKLDYRCVRPGTGLRRPSAAARFKLVQALSTWAPASPITLLSRDRA